MKLAQEDERFSTALDRYKAGAHEEAALLFASIVEDAPRRADALRLHGLALVRSGQAAAGLPSLARACRLAPDDPLSYLHHGIGLLEAGRPARAAARLRHAAQAMPESAAAWINLSAALLMLAAAPAARAAARRAIALAPETAEAHCAMGRAERGAGNLAGARAAFERAVALSPGFVEAWVDLGVTSFEQGSIGDATTAMHRALETKPGYAAAEANLAGFEIIQGEYQSGKVRLQSLVARQPESIAARLNLANAMLLDREAKEVLSLLDAPPLGGREGAHWRAHRALALLILGRDEEAEAELDAVPRPYGDVEILILWRRLVLAERANDLATADLLARDLETLADAEGPALLEHRILTRFDLAGYANRRRLPEQAMAHWIAAHRLMSRVQPFSRATFLEFVDTSMRCYDARRLEHGPRARTCDKAPVFVVGMPRSGTTLVEHILSAHAQVHGAGERAALHRTATNLAGPSTDGASIGRLAALDGDALEAASKFYLAELRAEASGERFVVDKMPGNALILGFLATLLPGARVILCNRDPRDIGLSIFQMRFFGYHPYAHDLEDLGWYLRQHERLMDHWRRTLPVPLLEIDLKDWVDNFDDTLARLLGFLDLPHDPACERFYEQKRLVRTASAAQVRQPITAQGIGRWRKFEDQLGPLLGELNIQDRS